MNSQPSPVFELHHSLWKTKGIRLFVKRDDLLDPLISGNKYRKLKYNLLEAKTQSHDTLLTFGGAYSNHIHATAAAGKKHGFKTIGIIRGERTEPVNPTLREAEALGMSIHYVERRTYRQKHSPEFLGQLALRFGRFYLIPEGGSNALAVKGCEEIIHELEDNYSYVCCSSGTGGTMAGIICGLKGKARVVGFPALKGGDFLRTDIRQLISERTQGKSFENWELMADYHFGGYAKFTPEFVQFIIEFRNHHGIPLDPVYTGKMFFGIYDLIAKDYFPPGSKILALHTGGLQGIRGFNERFDVNLPTR